MTGSAATDVSVVDGRPVNVATGTKPCVLHANGWEKLPLIEIVERCGRISKEERDRLLEEKQEFESKKVCCFS
jgi:hypothetical protein